MAAGTSAVGAALPFDRAEQDLRVGDCVAQIRLHIRDFTRVPCTRIAGTTAAKACSIPLFGPSVEERLQTETLQLPGVTHLIVWAGTNDLAFGCNAAQIIASYGEITRMAHPA